MKIHIRTTNDAFQDGNQGAELARILRKLADKLDDSDQPNPTTTPRFPVAGEWASG